VYELDGLDENTSGFIYSYRLIHITVICSLILYFPAYKLYELPPYFMCSDFGMMGEMKENLRDGLIEASVHLVNREFDSLASDFVTLG